MKELSIEQKAKAYDNVVDKLKQFMAQGVDPLITRANVQDFFPALKESEDERMIEFVKQQLFKIKETITENYKLDVKLKEAIVWLEKQNELANFLNNIQIGDKVTRNEDGTLFNLSQLNRVAKKQDEQKPDWSEEDELKFSDILALLRGGENCHYNTPDLFTWFKSLKDRVQPQNTWKPSDVQKKALKWVLTVPYCKYEKEINELLEQLEQL